MPSEVFAAYVASHDREDWSSLYDCFTPAAQDANVFEFMFQLGALNDPLVEEHIDPVREKQLEQANDTPKSEFERQQIIVSLLRDKRAFYIAASRQMSEVVKRHVRSGPLRETQIDGARARGICQGVSFRMTNDGSPVPEPFDIPIYFARGSSGWRIDVPTTEELNRDVQMILEDKSQ